MSHTAEKGMVFHGFHEREFLRVFAFGFELAQAGRGIDKPVEEGFARGACADDVRGDAVDAGIEEIEREIHAVDGVVSGEFEKHIADVVAEEHHMIRVPADGAAGVDEQFFVEGKMGRELVSDRFRGVKMAHVQAEEHAPAERRSWRKNHWTPLCNLPCPSQRVCLRPRQCTPGQCPSGRRKSRLRLPRDARAGVHRSAG